jgi:hypothetical protein
MIKSGFQSQVAHFYPEYPFSQSLSLVIVILARNTSLFSSFQVFPSLCQLNNRPSELKKRSKEGRKEVRQ